MHHNVDVEFPTHKESHKQCQTSKVVHWRKSYVELLSSIEVTLILPFYFALNERVSQTLVMGRHFEKTTFQQKFFSKKFAFMFNFLHGCVSHELEGAKYYSN